MIENAKNKAVKTVAEKKVAERKAKPLTQEVKEIKPPPIVDKVKVKSVEPVPVKAPQRPQYCQCWSCGRTVAVKKICDNCGKPLSGIV